MTGAVLDAERAPAALATQGVARSADSAPAPLVDAGTLVAWLRERAARPGPLVVQAIYDGLRMRVDRGDFSGSQLQLRSSAVSMIANDQCSWYSVPLLLALSPKTPPLAAKSLSQRPSDQGFSRSHGDRGDSPTSDIQGGIGGTGGTSSGATPSHADRGVRAVNDLSMTCECGAPALFRATGECQRCYDTRKSAPRRERLAAVYATPCTYEAAHSRVRSARGRASGWLCVECRRPADQWAYVGDSPREIRGQREYTRNGRHRTVTIAWSPDPADYRALCRSCHGRSTRPDYGRGYRHDAAARAAYLAKQREYHRSRHAQLAADPAAHEAYRARKRLEARRRRENARSTSTSRTTPPTTEGTPK